MNSAVSSSDLASVIPDASTPSLGVEVSPERPRAVVVIGPGQVVTSVVLRSLGWEVTLASSAEAARHIARQHHALLLFVRVSSSYLRSMRCTPVPDVTVVAVVDAEEDGPLPGFDVTIAIDDVEELTALIRSAAPTVRHLRAAADRTSEVMRKSDLVDQATHADG